ncbi:TetR/AcrR family transcriptional regulator [Convivina intestini]|uniref:TetR family transcriptional regulator n=1 Tax=Convivina intestini TaxID=1505726 RepID=A0A2U1D646_9LACO|nr:TetR/AcrR family transcriptional regulator [Convivina intestini]PVY83130.1 TetR family transcriptional regulator [Convivina intestini]CAH1856375.1 putative HTH-type transcriptional regulator YfiR [Convivina intestini]SDB95070.1 transcriptional regulator, TetR family [Leuconostocaceae bacterium R-53105]
MSSKGLTKKSELKKAAILSGARRVFAQKGFLSVTMKDIIDACHISRGGIYLYFDSVDDIFFEAVTQRSVRQFDNIREEIKKNPPFNLIFKNYLAEQKKRLLNYDNNDDSLLRAMYEYSFTHHADRDKKLKQKQMNATKATVRSLLALGVKQGVLSGQNIKVIADNFMLLIEGMNIMALTGELKAQQIDSQFELFAQSV